MRCSKAHDRRHQRDHVDDHRRLAVAARHRRLDDALPVVTLMVPAVIGVVRRTRGSIDALVMICLE